MTSNFSHFCGNMRFLRKTGLVLFVFGLLGFTLTLLLSQYRLTDTILEEQVAKPVHREMIFGKAMELGVMDERYTSSFQYVPALTQVLRAAQQQLETNATIIDGKSTTLAESIAEWDFRMSEGDLRTYKISLTKHASRGMLVSNRFWFLLFTVGLGVFGALIYLLPQLSELPGLRNKGPFHRSLTKGISPKWHMLLLTATILLVFIVSVFQYLWPAALTLIAGAAIVYAVRKQEKRTSSSASAPDRPGQSGWLGIALGGYLLVFYIVLYWWPEYLVNWIWMVDPISRAISGNEAGHWFLYGFLYTVVMLVMGTRMIIRYQHSRYQLIRTGSVLFFQTAFAFLIPEILVRLNQPYFDFKNIWPLDYDFFFEWNLQSLTSSGKMGIFMLAWGIALFLVGVPVFTYFFGKRWYCSWVCGCGGLAETLGDPFRHLSDKRLRAWRFERWMVHGVLVFSTLMTLLVLYTFFTGKSSVIGLDSYQIRGWYGFLIGSAFAGVVGTGFYPLMGNRVWCRFGCPLAAYLGLIQKFKSRFRITVNGSQCISCGQCSTHCEMGIDVRWYAQRGQDILRASCVGCGICAEVCPRGVLRLENAAADVQTRATELRAIHIRDGAIHLEG